ncbi:MAG: hypothetical protein AUK47_22780 [Deltaproteobacteria bacterium CG2_30_63_29]|nr:MAG: hypothetical protein AUK47_22780 [Deltaproteobacteria bacterium CG2_30_63_29]
MPVDEAKALNAAITGDYENTKSTWEAAQTNAGQMGELSGVDVKTLDIVNIKTQLETCFKTPVETLEAMKAEAGQVVEDAGQAKDQTAAKDANQGLQAARVGYANVKNCGPASEESLAGYTANADDQAGALTAAKITQVDNLRKDLLYVLPTNVTNLLASAPDTIKNVAEIRAKAEAALKATEANALASAEEKAKAKADYDGVIADLDAAEATANAVLSDLANLPTDIASLANKVGNDLQNFGQPSGS